MKIGIVTLIGEYNYGNLLQSYALQTILERMGHDVVTLNRRSSKPRVKQILLRFASVIKCIIKRFILGRKEILVVNPFAEYYCARNRVYRLNLMQFVHENIKRTKALRSNEELKKFSESKDIDAYIVGSDQIWREDYVYDIKESFLSFLPKEYNGKRIAYAASFGKDSNFISQEKLPICKDLLKLFDAISVREKSAEGICKKVFNVEAKWILDPTMLLSREDYCTLFHKSQTLPSKGKLIYYVLDSNETILKHIEQIAQNLGLKSHNCYVSKYKGNSIQYDLYLPPVEQWLKAFEDAEYVITDSFHACVFSILFNKPFVCIGNKSRGNARFDSLLGLFGLEFRLVEGLSDIEEKILIPIDWDRVNKILKEKRKEANEFIVNALK